MLQFGSAFSRFHLPDHFFQNANFLQVCTYTGTNRHACRVKMQSGWQYKTTIYPYCSHAKPGISTMSMCTIYVFIVKIKQSAMGRLVFTGLRIAENCYKGEQIMPILYKLAKTVLKFYTCISIASI